MAEDDKLKNLIFFKDSKNISDFICLLCEDIVQIPVRCKDCAALYCSECANSLINKRKNCIQHFGQINLLSDFTLGNIIKTEMYFKCKNAGCVFTSQSISEISYHLIDCKLINKKCPNQGCDFTGSEVELESHKGICKYFYVKCSVCSFKLFTNQEITSHNCMIKIVEQISKLEENLKIEKEKLNTYIDNKKAELMEIVIEKKIDLNFCKICKGLLIWSPHATSIIQDDSHTWCSSKDQPDVCAQNYKFVCKKCRICYCTNCVVLKAKNICYCGKEMTINNLKDHYCDVCKTVIERGWTCGDCLFDVCLNCLPNNNTNTNTNI